MYIDEIKKTMSHYTKIKIIQNKKFNTKCKMMLNERDKRVFVILNLDFLL